jgi:DNA-directed RNA polymerase sigma subunit (sigma70/sigma32)
MTIKTARTMQVELNMAYAVKLRATGMTLQAIGDALGGYSRERIRQYIAKAKRIEARKNK